MKMKPHAVIVDVDGTLVDVSGVRHYVVGREKHKKDFEHFHAGAALCPPHEPVLRAVKALASAGFAIIVVTARKQRWEFQTRRWLRKWEVPLAELHMRADDDERRDVEVKRDILAALRERFDIVHAIDDNPSVIALWKSEDIPVTVVPGWQEEPA